MATSSNKYQLAGCKAYRCSRPADATSAEDQGVSTPYVVTETDLRAPPYYFDVSVQCDVGYDDGVGIIDGSTANDATPTVTPVQALPNVARDCACCLMLPMLLLLLLLLMPLLLLVVLR